MIVKFVITFDEIIEQHQPITILKQFIHSGKIPHTLLFVGNDGVGKRTTAVAFAMACNCTHNISGYLSSNHRDDRSLPTGMRHANACGECRSCRNIAASQNPDVILLYPSGALLRISQIRELQQTLSMKPYAAQWRIVIINDAQTLNPEASNALLKLLEEPPSRTIIILTTDHTTSLLPTVVSRCQKIPFNPISSRALAKALKAKNVAAKEADVIAVMANGSFSQAIKMAESYWIFQRNWLINELTALPRRPMNAVLALAEIISNQKNELADLLTITYTWFRDLLIYHYNPKKIINSDRGADIDHFSKKSSPSTLLEQLQAIQKAQRLTQSNANTRLTLERMFLQIWTTGTN